MVSPGSGPGADGHTVLARVGAKTGPDDERVLAWVRTGWGGAVPGEGALGPVGRASDGAGGLDGAPGAGGYGPG
ncbi:hypothetical protein STRTUCAR8_00078 [Streptomyces turgidiscabies Car8]|uniref:Uncharacterized protein n=1 Tax=Streptomyces turgidiscabies (strain Car8) TaxID=698760 RepID=L7FF35_STRT8|nr:hypothetical protein STRTUCAR8_00078 [Streptomyces turgidiscabies Car8]